MACGRRIRRLFYFKNEYEKIKIDYCWLSFQAEILPCKKRPKDAQPRNEVA